MKVRLLKTLHPQFFSIRFPRPDRSIDRSKSSFSSIAQAASAGSTGKGRWTAAPRKSQRKIARSMLTCFPSFSSHCNERTVVKVHPASQALSRSRDHRRFQIHPILIYSGPPGGQAATRQHRSVQVSSSQYSSLDYLHFTHPHLR